jgi:amino-acid N-acetyltransferase
MFTKADLIQDFFLSVLGSSATKREARSYLKNFTPPKIPQSAPSSVPPLSISEAIQKDGVLVGNVYGSVRSVAESPKFVQQPSQQQIPRAADPPLHLALVKLRSPQTLDDETLHGIGRTLTQLGRLGLLSIVIVDCNDSTTSKVFHRPGWKDFVSEQCDRVVAAIEANSSTGARVVDNVIGINEQMQTPFSSRVRGRAHVTYRKLLMTPLKRSLIPVIPSLGHTASTQAAEPLDGGEVVMALTREFSGFQPEITPDEDHAAIKERIEALRKEVSLDRLIILDPLGGIPAAHRPNGRHVFLNMEQEYENVKEELSGGESCYFENSSSIPKCAPESSAGSLKSTSEDYGIHIRNLDLVKDVLSLLPPTSSALLTTPEEAANSGKEPDAPFKASGVGTRRQRNPLIHNLLTDKPAFSSSLPITRLRHSNDQAVASNVQVIAPTTFAKKGMPLTIYPDPRVKPWEPPAPGKPQITLQDPRIDLSRLVYLIDDSFNRKLDVQDYLKRVNDRIAGVIIAGEYEGGALLTWETPPGVVDDGSDESRARMVPYLDKFAVLKRSQGSGGVADVVFKAMVRDCFPDGVCWRSRQDNPVNKWYFERSRGTWRLPGSNWTMFWTTPDLSMDEQKFLDYKGVCETIQPSWADNKAIVD